MLTEKELEVLNKIKASNNKEHLRINNNHKDLAKSVGLSVEELDIVLDSLVKKKKLVIVGQVSISSTIGGKKDYRGRTILENGLCIDNYKVI